MKESTIKKYIKSSFEELTQVVWPTKNQAVRLSIIVIAFCTIVALFLGLLDFGFSEAQSYLLKLRS